MCRIVMQCILFVGLFGLVLGGSTICRDDHGITHAICYDGEECCGDDNKECCKVGMPLWVLMAIVIGSVVGVSIIVITIVAICQKMKKKNKVANPTGQNVTTIADYYEPPPSYSNADTNYNDSFGQTSRAHPPAYNPACSEQKKPL